MWKSFSAQENIHAQPPSPDYLMATALLLSIMSIDYAAGG